MALIIRLELFEPGMQILETKEQYNQMFTMHGTVMLLIFATPLFAGFANVLMPLQIGAPDVAFPRMNSFAFWLFSLGSSSRLAGFLTPQGAASFGWTAYAPLSNTTFTPGARRQPLGDGPCLPGLRNHPRLGELHHDDPHAACAGHDDVPHVHLHAGTR